MQKWFIATSFVLFSPQTFAVGFHCYTWPNAPTQVYQYGSSNCGQGTSGTGLSDSGERDIVCMMNAHCEAVSDEEAKQPAPQKSLAQLTADMQNGVIKSSLLICKGRGQYTDGVLISSNCGTADTCREDVFFNFAPSTPMSTVAVPVTVPPANSPEISR